MMSHLVTHTNYKSRTKRAAKLPEVFECDVCHSKFTLRKNYMRHKKLVYDDTESPRNICGLCCNLFWNSKLLKRHHIEAHQDYSCPTCDNFFTTKRALDQHIKKKSSSKCNVCEKSFCSKKALIVHMSCP